MDPPLISQDEFFRILELQSVKTVRGFTYRQALKERLRSVTKKDALSFTVVNKDAKSKSNANEKRNRYTKLCSPKACRRRVRSKASQSQRLKSSALKNYFKVFVHPRIKDESDKGELLGENPSTIKDRKLYWDEKTPSTSYAHYTCLVRPQKASAIELVPELRDSNGVRLPVPPGQFPLLDRPLVQKSHLRFDRHHILAQLDKEKRRKNHLRRVRRTQQTTANNKDSTNRSSFAILTVKHKTATTNNNEATNLDRDLFPCRVCAKRFSSAKLQKYHEENSHGVCKICRRMFDSSWKAKIDFCDECGRLKAAASNSADRRPKTFSSAAMMNINACNRYELIRWLQKHNLFAAFRQEQLRPMIKSLIRSLPSPPPLRCDLCPTIFLTRELLIQHLVTRHEEHLHAIKLHKFVSAK